MVGQDSSELLELEPGHSCDHSLEVHLRLSRCMKAGAPSAGDL